MLAPKTKVINRKAIRFKKFVIITSLSLGIFTVIWLGGIVVMLQFQPLYASPLPLTKLFSPKQADAEEQISTALQTKKIPFTTIQQGPNASYVISLEKGEQVIVSSEKDIEAQISSLQVILFRLTMEGKRLLKLDLRFQNPIITLE